jgi:hypothetical protein
MVFASRRVGTLAEGGAFERPIVIVSIVGGGRITRMEFFEPEDVDAALARFSELRPNPLRIPPNAATRAFDRRLEASRAGDWQALEVLCAPTFVFDDRRRTVRRPTGGRDLLIANDRYIFSRGARLVHRVLATAGDRLALQHHTWREADGGAPFEIETFVLIEVDAEGRLVTMISFNPDDRRAASAELLDRYARSDEARDIPPELFESQRALNAHDLDGLRAALPRDYVYEDHHRTGIGRLESAEAYLASLGPVFELSPDAILEPLYTLATEKHGQLAMAHGFGTLADGGEWESVYAVVSRYEGGRFVGLEMFEPEDLDAARARFEALRNPQTQGVPTCPPESRKTATST